MGRKKKTVLYKYKNKNGEEAIGFIDPKKARQVESFRNARKRRKEIPPAEKENGEK